MKLIIVAVVVVAIIVFLVFRKKKTQKHTGNYMSIYEKEEVYNEIREKSKNTSDILVVCFPSQRPGDRTQVHYFKNGEELETQGSDLYSTRFYLDNLSLSTDASHGRIYKGAGDYSF